MSFHSHQQFILYIPGTTYHVPGTRHQVPSCTLDCSSGFAVCGILKLWTESEERHLKLWLQISFSFPQFFFIENGTVSLVIFAEVDMSFYQTPASVIFRSSQKIRLLVFQQICELIEHLFQKMLQKK